MKLYKRKKDDPLAPWYCQFVVRGRAYQWSTKTEDPFLARKRAKNYRDAAVAESYHLVSGMKARGGSSSFQQLVDEYLTFPAPEEKTKAINVSGLKRVLAASGLSMGTGVDRLGVEVALKWQQVAKAQQVPVATINGVLRRARSLFSRNAMLLYKNKPAAELVKQFFSVPALKVAEHRIELPSADAMAKVEADIINEPALHRAYLLARYGGLRAGEIRAARKDWIDGATLYVGGKPTEFVTKSGKWRAVALPAQVVPILMGGEGYYIVGESRDRDVERRLPAFLQARGFPKAKPIHSLRRWFGHTIYNEQSPNAARISLGHSSLQVTELAYARAATIAAPIAYRGPVAPPPDPVPIAEGI